MFQLNVVNEPNFVQQKFKVSNSFDNVVVFFKENLTGKKCSHSINNFLVMPKNVKMYSVYRNEQVSSVCH